MDRRISTGIGFMLLLVTLLPACAVQKRIRSNALDFVYPDGAEASPPKDVELQLPLRVGLAFAPAATNWQDTFTESQKQELLERIAAAFRDRDTIQAVEAIPSDYLSPGGGFENIDRLRVAFGIDLLALVSYDQFQFSGSTTRSWTYWTLVGAYAVKGEKNETRTVLNATIFDIPSRAMLFHASGESSVSGRSSPVSMEKELRVRSGQGFAEATDDLIAKLDTGLDEFQRQAATGPVRGPGTPSLTIVDSGAPSSGGGLGAGASGMFEIVILSALALAAGAMRRPRAGRRRA